MTLTELQAKRDEILKQIDISRAQSGSDAVEFVQDRVKALAVIEREIAAQSGNRLSRTTYASFSKG